MGEGQPENDALEKKLGRTASVHFGATTEGVIWGRDCGSGGPTV